MVGVPSLGALVATSSIFLRTSYASPVQSDAASIETRQEDFFVVHGIEGDVQPRLNVRDLERKAENKDLWTLYILAVQRLQAIDQKEKTSFYQIAGTLLSSVPYAYMYLTVYCRHSWTTLDTMGRCAIMDR
jgi:tyrosinase